MPIFLAIFQTPDQTIGPNPPNAIFPYSFARHTMPPGAERGDLEPSAKRALYGPLNTTDRFITDNRRCHAVNCQGGCF